MFYYLEGVVSIPETGIAVVDCNGVGFCVNTTVNSLSRVKPGEKTRFYIYNVVREDCFDLYGFTELEEKRCFELLLGVSGVGPKMALSVLSSNTPAELAGAVFSGNEKALTCISGVGKKTAQRILLELKDKIDKWSDYTAGQAPQPSSGIKSVGINQVVQDATAALMVLGFSSQEISTAIKNLDLSGLTVEETIRLALKKLR